jgi:hypothetical protein
MPAPAPWEALMNDSEGMSRMSAEEVETKRQELLSILSSVDEAEMKSRAVSSKNTATMTELHKKIVSLETETDKRCNALCLLRALKVLMSP